MAREIPLLSSPGLTGWAEQYAKSPLDVLVSGCDKLGLVYRFRMNHRMIYVASDPAAADHILRTNARNYKKTVFTKNFKRLLGNGLLTSDGEFWLRQRRLSQPLFGRTRISEYFAVMARHADALALRLGEAAKRGEVVNLHDSFMQVATEIILSTMLDADLLPGDFAKIRDSLGKMLIYHEKSKARWINWPLWLPVHGNTEFAKARQAIVDIVLRIIEGFRRDPSKKTSLLAWLIQAKDDETNDQMTEAQLVDEIFTFIAAGLDTSANLLTWAVYLGSLHPESWSRLGEEARGFSSAGSAPELFQGLPYTMNVLHEAMRLYPPAFIIGRSPKEEDVAGGFRFPKDATIWICPYLMHRHPEVWERPLEFDPDRFLTMKSYETEKRYVPFAKGPRVCIGKDFAMAESAIVLSRLARDFVFELDPRRAVIPKATVTMRPESGLFVTPRIK